MMIQKAVHNSYGGGSSEKVYNIVKSGDTCIVVV